MDEERGFSIKLISSSDDQQLSTKYETGTILLLSFGKDFRMQTIRQKPGLVELPEQTFNEQFSQKIVPQIKNKDLKISDSLSWIACLGVVTLLTGLLKFLELGVTMSSVTNVLFFLSIGGIAGFLVQIFHSIKTDRVIKQGSGVSHLN